jgi:hypothetical protein
MTSPAPVTTQPTSWPQRLMPVPTRYLRVDPDIAAQSPKGYSRAELADMAKSVRTVYARMDAGQTREQLLDARCSADPGERLVGRTYANLFAASLSAQPLTAEIDGRDLQVSAGNHRAREAQAAGVPVLPVFVKARTEAELDAAQAQFAQDSSPEYQQAVRAHQSQSAPEQVQAGRVRPADREVGRDIGPRRARLDARS